MKMLINGEWRDSIRRDTLDVFNPATHDKIDSIPRGTSEDIDMAVEAAKYGLSINRKLPVISRRRYLVKAAESLRDNLDDLAGTMVAENGKSRSWAEYEVMKSAEILENLADRAMDPQGETYPMSSMDGCAGQMAFVYRQPRGIVGGIIPFNFPLEMLAYKLGGALCAGNSVVLKLSEDCPLTCLKVGGLFLAAGVPKEVFHLVTGYGEEAGNALVEHKDVPMITFTGSTAVGKIIMEKSAKHLKHLSLELGGNDPVIVFEDADLSLIARNLVRGRMTVGNGQACVADKRFIVHEDIAEELLNRCKLVVEALKMGDPADPSVEVGPVINERAAVRIEKMINEAVEKGARIVCGGNRVDQTFIEPTILGNVDRDMLIAREECFGPVAPFLTFRTEEEALDIANDSPYGLQGAVYTKDISKAMRVADALEVGGVVVNGSSCFRPGNVPYMPRKSSGIGTDNLYNTFNEMTQGKAVVINNAIDTALS